MQQLREAVQKDAVGRMEKVRCLVDEIERDADEMCCAERLFQKENYQNVFAIVIRK